MGNAEWNDNPNPRDNHKRIPSQLFHQTATHRNIKHSIPFVCPFYILDDNMQQQRPTHKWKVRTRMGLYLGRSPIHARTISLVLNLTTGRVRPQFHCYHDKGFDSVKETQNKDDQLWQIRAGFVRIKDMGPHVQTGPPQREQPTQAAPTMQNEQQV